MNGNGNGNGNKKPGLLRWTARNLWMALVIASGSFVITKVLAFDWFDTSRFLPHGLCYGWNFWVVWVHAVADSVIGIGFMIIPAQLLYIYVHRKRGEWSGLCPAVHVYPSFIWYGMFIFLCGLSHITNVITIWKPYYLVHAFILILVAIATLGAVVETQLHIQKVNEGARYSRMLASLAKEMESMRSKKDSG